jgi:hypothetical protein
LPDFEVDACEDVQGLGSAAEGLVEILDGYD